jgi:hypothetical protein
MEMLDAKDLPVGRTPMMMMMTLLQYQAFIQDFDSGGCKLMHGGCGKKIAHSA